MEIEAPGIVGAAKSKYRENGMIVLDILCIYSCMRMAFLHRECKKVYFVLKGDGLFDALTIRALTRFGWEFIQLEYDLGPTDSHSPYVDIQTELYALMEKDIEPVIAKEMSGWKSFSEYEKRHLLLYMSFLERNNIHQKIEILHVIELLKDQIGRPDAVLLYCARWKELISARYAGKGYRVSFYKIYFPIKLRHKKDYYSANMAEGFINRRGFRNLAFVVLKIAANILNCAYSGILKYFRPEVPKKIEKYDICAIVPGYKMTKWSNDLLWKREVKGKSHRTLAILYGPFDGSTYDSYGYLAEGWVNLDKAAPSPHLRSAFYWLWPVFPKVLIRNISGFIRDIFNKHMPLDYTATILYFLLEESKLEALFKITGARLFWSSIGLIHLQSLAGIIAINRLGGVSVGAVWSSYMMSLTALPLHNNDVFFIWGQRHAHIFDRAISKSKILSGYLGDSSSGHYLAKAKIMREEWRIRFGGKAVLCFYDDYFARDDGYNFNGTTAYVNNLLMWVIKRPDTMLVIKSKRQDIFSMYPSTTTELLKTLESHQRLIYEFEWSDLAPGFAADIVLGVGLTTMPSLMGTYGKRVISFDCNRCNERWPVGTDNIAYISQPDEVIKKLDDWLENLGAQNINGVEIKPVPNRLDGFVDGKSAERIGGYMSDLIEDIKRGYNSDQAISNANRIFSERWGSDKVIEADRSRNESI